MKKLLSVACFNLLVSSMSFAGETNNLSIITETRNLRQELKTLQNKQHLFIQNETELISQLNDNFKEIQSAKKLWSETREDLDDQKKTYNPAWIHYLALQKKYDLTYQKYIDKKAYTDFRTTEYNIAKLQKKISQLFGHKKLKPNFFKSSKEKLSIKTNKRN